ncbi:uncharacterized protein RSE6_05060 [Rhynchosporium secalis]|uniref:Uncharacterized protein n=1 Tax=Rhynchosporium secalis TaxID=38038 RepID=A0A1E1M6U1_RHYSE|nr:uncharacterized protein RSE6_05060 [Rhynchosporium secalis]
MKISTNGLPAAYFSVLYREPDGSAQKYYQAVYLTRRKAEELKTSISTVCDFGPTRILQMTNVNQNSFTIEVGDDIVVQRASRGPRHDLVLFRITTPVDTVLESEE